MQPLDIDLVKAFWRGIRDSAGVEYLTGFVNGMLFYRADAELWDMMLKAGLGEEELVVRQAEADRAIAEIHEKIDRIIADG